MERFTDYIMQHGVCPEYTSDIPETLDIYRRRQVVDELSVGETREAQQWLHENFNMACPMLLACLDTVLFAHDCEWKEVMRQVTGKFMGRKQSMRSRTNELANEEIRAPIAYVTEEWSDETIPTAI